MSQIEITSPVSIIDDMGLPRNFGWSKTPCFFYDPGMIYQSRYRITEYDRYIAFTPTHMFIFEIRDDGWLGYMGITVISMRDKKRVTQTYSTFLPLGDYELPTSSEIGSVNWAKGKTRLDFICAEKGAKIIKADIPKLGHHQSMRGALVLIEPESSDSLVTNQGWREEKHAFRYSRHSPWFYAEGVIQFGSSEIIFTKGNGWGIYEWIRCARPKADIRFWAAGCGHSGGRQLSFCVGYSWADFAPGTENGFFVDGKLHKLDQVTFHIPTSQWLSPWRFSSSDNRLEMEFFPHQERIDRRNALFYNSSRRQVCGFFSGKVQLDDGSVIEFQNLTGFSERSKTRF